MKPAQLAGICALFFFLATSAQAQTSVTWNGGSGSWGVPSNWSPGIVPNISGSTTYNVFIDGGQSTHSNVLLNLNVSIANLTIDQHDQLSVSGNLAPEGDTLVNGTLSIASTGVLSGAVLSLTIGSTGVLNNAGTVSDVQPIIIASGGVLNNRGNFDRNIVSSNGVLNNWGSIFSMINGGIVNNYGSIGSNDLTPFSGFLYNAPGAGFSATDCGNGVSMGLINGGFVSIQRTAGFLSGTPVNLSSGVLQISIAESTVATGDFINQGTVQVFEDAGLYVQGSYLNSGTTELTDGGSLTVHGDYIQQSGATLIQPISVGALNVNGTAFFLGGVLAGGASTPGGAAVNGNVFMAGQLRPDSLFTPASTGILSINGNYTQANTGAYTADIGGLFAGTEHDQVQISGQANLDGLLRLFVLSGFNPQIGNSFTIMTFGSLSGAFSSVSWSGLPQGLMFIVSYNSNDVTVSVAQSPEPSTLILLATGICAVIGFHRRRQIRSADEK